MVYKLVNANVEVCISVGKHYLQNLDTKYNIKYFLCTRSFLPNMNYSLFMFKLYAIGACSYKALPTTTTEILNQSLFFNSFFIIKRKPIVVKSFILSKLFFLLRDIWDNERHDFITSIQLWSKLNVKSSWISEWMLIKKAVPDSLMCALKHDILISNSNNDLKLLNLKLYEQKGKLILKTRRVNI